MVQYLNYNERMQTILFFFVCNKAEPLILINKILNKIKLNAKQKKNVNSEKKKQCLLSQRFL